MQNLRHRINVPFVILGLVLSLGSVAGVFLLGRLVNPPPVQIPVALADIPAGTSLAPGLFRLEAWIGVRPETRHAIVSPETFPSGALTLVDVPAGSPLYKAYVDSEHTREFVTRLSELVEDKGQLVMAIPVDPDLGGNVPRPGDEVDLVFSLGSLRGDVVQSHPTPTSEAALPGIPMLDSPQATDATTETLSLPLSVLILANIPVLQVEYKQVSTSSGTGVDGAPQMTTVQGPAERLYVAVDRAQAETLAFLLHNGDALLAIHKPGLTTDYPGGMAWEDFETLFFDQRATPTPSPQ